METANMADNHHSGFKNKLQTQQVNCNISKINLLWWALSISTTLPVNWPRWNLQKKQRGFEETQLTYCFCFKGRTSQTSKELSHQQDAIIFLVETANMADIHHTGLYTVLYILKQTYLHWPQLEFCIPPPVYKYV